MIKYISRLIFLNFNSYSNDTFYIGKKRLPLSLRKNNKTNGYTVKMGSGFMSYTLETTKEELKNLSVFVNNFIDKN